MIGVVAKSIEPIINILKKLTIDVRTLGKQQKLKIKKSKNKSLDR